MHLEYLSEDKPSVFADLRHVYPSPAPSASDADSMVDEIDVLPIIRKRSMMETKTEETTRSESSSKETVWTRAMIAASILDGKLLIIYDAKVFDLTQWAPLHPGGALAILHMIGRDATAQINVYHDRFIASRMAQYQVGQLATSDWNPLTPPIQLGWDHRELTEQKSYEPKTLYATSARVALKGRKLPCKLTVEDLEPTQHPQTTVAKLNRENKAFLQLHKDIEKAGLIKLGAYSYLWDVVRYGAIMAVFLTSWASGHWIVSAIALGALWQQLVFLVHDAGHLGISGRYKTDTLLGCAVASFMGGLSVMWWKYNHNVHHIMCNSLEHDPDIQHVPFLAINSKYHDNLESSFYSRSLIFCRIAKLMIPIQHTCYYLIMSLARFNLYRLSYIHLLQSKKTAFVRLEMVGVLSFWCWYSFIMMGLPDWPTRIAYTMISHMITGILHVQITLSHFGMSTEDHGTLESYASLQLRTTMDVECPWYMDFFHGGLQNQVSHHLFPRVPRHNLPAVKSLVRAWAKEKGIDYTIHTFSKGNGVVLGVLKDVGDQVRLLGQVAKAGAQGLVVIELDTLG